MTNRELAATLFNIATILREREDNPYRIRAYENAARALMGRRDNVAGILTQPGQTLRRRKGVLGDKVQAKLRQLAAEGHMPFFDDLCADLPPHIAALMQAPGMGPKTARQVYEALGVRTPDELRRAARDGRLASVWGFGAKRTAQVAQMSLFDEIDMAGEACRSGVAKQHTGLKPRATVTKPAFAG